MSRWIGLGLAMCLGFLGVAVPTLAGCSHQTPVTLEASDSGQAVKIDPGRRVVVTLPSNPTTGYTWSVSNLAGLRQVGDSEYTAPKTDRLGAEGVQTFTFTATERTSGQLTLEYRRPWEKEAAPARMWSVKVSVE